MAILNDLIVRGATRCLNTLYANSLQVDSQTISGNLTVNGYTYMGYSTSRSDTKLSVAGITNNQWYRSTGSVGWYNDSYGGGIYMTEPTYVKTYNNKAFYAYNGLYTGSTQQYYLNVNGKLNAADGVFSNNLNVGNSLVGRNISVTNLLRAAKYDLQTITQVGSNGTLYVAPSIQFPTSNTTSVTAASTSITIIDTNITSDVMAGVVWRPSAKVKISGTINGVVTGTVDGTITSINTSSKTMVIGNLSGGNWSSVVAGTYTKDKIENLNIMMYETYQNSTYYPVGILLTSYGSVGEHTDGTAKTFIDIYGGSATKPVVRLGSMTGLDAINGVTPSGWGLYTSNGYFSGLIVSTSGKIGGWSLSTNSLTTGTWGSSGSAMLCTGSTTQKAIGGSPASTSGWVFTAGANFGVTSSGALYANSAHISGEITATSGTIGGASITGGTLLIKDANISGKISASHIDVSSITIGSLSGADNYALKDDVPTTVAELTDSGSYLTTTVAANTYATQSNFDSLREDFDNYVAPIASKEYSNIIATANNDAKGTFYFGNIKPIDYYTPWKIKYRVQVKINGITDGYETSDIIISGAKNTYYAYQTYNSITNTSYRPYYYHILYTCTQTGISNGYGHLFGISLRYSYNPTTTSNARKINVDVVETEGCTVTLEDAPFLYANAAGTGSTNYVNRYSFDATAQGYTESGDRNETNHILNNFSGKTGAKGVWGGSLFMKDGNGKYQNICLASDGTATSASSGNGARTVATTKIVNPNGFEVGGSIYYSGTSYNANTNMSSNNVYASYGAFDSRYSINSTLTANFLTPYAPIYLVGTINQTDNLFYLDSTWWTQTANNKNKVYIYIGNVYDSTTSYCRFSLAEDNTWLVYDGSKLINYQKNESDNAAKTATSYITYVNATDGIKVHNASDTTNYLQLNSSAISMYKGGTKIFNTDSNGYVTVGKVAASRRNVYITDDAVQIRNNTSVLAEYGSSIKLYKPSTTTTAVEISSTGAIFTGNVIATSLSTGTKTASTTGKGTYIDGSGNIYVGNGSTNNFTVTDTGTITATGANLLTATIGNATNKISIGTGTSGHSSIQYGMTTLADTSHDGFYIGTDGIALGKGTFKVTAAGDVTATSLFIGINQVTNLQTTLEGKQAAGDYATNTDLVDAIDNIEVGGRNLLKYDVKNYGITSSKIIALPKCRGMYFSCEGNQIYTISRKRVEGNRFYIVTTTEEPVDGLTCNIIFDENDSILKYTFTTPSTAKYVFIYLSNKNDVINNGNIKAEKGNKATDWTPAPEDVEIDIEEAKKVATNYLSADSTGIMVADMQDGEQIPSTATGRNVFIDSDSVDIRDGQKTLASFRGEDTKFYDVNSDNKEVASFGSNGVCVGNKDEQHFIVDTESIQAINENGSPIFSVTSTGGTITTDVVVAKGGNSQGYTLEVILSGMKANENTQFYVDSLIQNVDVLWSTTPFDSFYVDGETASVVCLPHNDPDTGTPLDSRHRVELPSFLFTYGTPQHKYYHLRGTFVSNGGNTYEYVGTIHIQYDGQYKILMYAPYNSLAKTDGNVEEDVDIGGWCMYIWSDIKSNLGYSKAPAMTFGTRSNRSVISPLSVTIGEELYANCENQLSIGKYNLNNDEFNPLAFVIGNGIDDTDRSNAFSVDWDGDTEVSGNLTVAENINVIGRLTSDGNSGLFVLDTASTVISSIGANSSSRGNINITKSGYTPIAIAGFGITGDNGWCVFPRCYITKGEPDSTIDYLNYYIWNQHTKVTFTNVTVEVKILYIASSAF